MILLMAGCSCKPDTIYLNNKIQIPQHATLETLTQDEYEKLDPIVRDKIESVKAALIANIKKLEILIEAHNEINNDLN